MGRMYSASVSVAVTAVQDFFEVNVASTSMVKIHSVFIGQSSDFADAQAEMLQFTLARGGGTAGSGGSTLTARPHQVGHAAYGGTVEANNTTESGTQTILQQLSMNVQAGLFYVPTPEEQIWVPPSGIFIVGLLTTPNDSLTMQGTVVFEEFD